MLGCMHAERGEACGGRPECGGEWAAKTVKRPPHQPAQPPVRQPLGPANAETTPAGTQAAAADSGRLLVPAQVLRRHVDTDTDNWRLEGGLAGYTEAELFFILSTLPQTERCLDMLSRG